MRPRPRSVLDVGCGCGKWGVLLREYLDPSAAANRGQRRARIDAVETFEGYIGKLHQAVYDDLYIGTAPEVLYSIRRRYDLVLAVDVLEHFERQPGYGFLAACRSRGPTLIVTPTNPAPQGAVYGNDWETHKSRWTRSALTDAGASAVVPLRVRGRGDDWLAWFPAILDTNQTHE